MSDFTFTFHFHALEKEMATHSSVLAWRIPGIGEPGGLPSLGSHRVGHDWSDLAAAYTPTPCWLKHLCSIRALVPVSFFLSLSLSLSPRPLSLFFRLIPWSAEALWVHFPARASKTLSRRCSVPSPHREGTWGLREQSKSCVRGFIGFLCKPGNISLFLSFTFLSSTPYHQVPVH